MERQTDNSIVLVVRPTRLDDLMRRFNTLDQARFYIEHSGADFGDYQREHVTYHAAVRHARAALDACGRVQLLDRQFLANFLFDPHSIIVVLGQDGLVANSLKYLDGQQVIGVNPDPGRWDGVLLPFRVDDLPRVIPEVFSGRRAVKSVTLAKARLNDGQEILAVNDLFIGPRTHISIRYHLRIGNREETQSSSGIIVSTGLGSTGWFKSLIAGAHGIMRGLTATSGMPTAKDISMPQPSLSWDARHIYFMVREPFPSRTSGADIVIGKITEQAPLIIESRMPENGVIFSDGIEHDYLNFNSGTTATIGLAEKQGHLVV